MQVIRIFIYVCVLAVLATPAQVEQQWKKITNEWFSFSLPSAFKKTSARGIDSFVQEFVTDQVRLSFDYGNYSNNFSDWPANTKFENVTINGKAARIGTVAQAIHSGYPYSTQIYFKLGDDLSLSMFAACKTEKQITLAKRIFETIAFTS